MKKTLRGPNGLTLHLDTDAVVEDDPGADTPAMVYLPFGRGSATFWCASETGEVTGGRHCDDYTELNEAQCNWLNRQHDAVNDFLYGEH